MLSSGAVVDTTEERDLVMERLLPTRTLLLAMSRMFKENDAEGDLQKEYGSYLRSVKGALRGDNNGIDLAAAWVVLNFEGLKIGIRYEVRELFYKRAPGGTGPGFAAARLLGDYALEEGDLEVALCMYDTLLALPSKYRKVLEIAVRARDDGADGERNWPYTVELRWCALLGTTLLVERYRDDPYAMGMLLSYCSKVSGPFNSRAAIDVALAKVWRTVALMLQGRRGVRVR